MSSDENRVGLLRNKGLVSLDAMRGLAALSVAIPHYFLFQGHKSASLEFISIIAVEVFFALSGYVLARQLVLCVETSSLRNLCVFYARRWMRTLPPYLIILVIMSLLAGRLFSLEFLGYGFFVRNHYCPAN
jgi:peptidoglycan/LPS O-acetylase OafA/YrhL